MGCRQHPTKFGNSDHSLTKRDPFRAPISVRILRPQKVFHRDTAQVRPCDPETVNPAAETTFYSGMPDVVIHSDGPRIETSQYFMEIPYRRADEANAGVSVIHRPHSIMRIQACQFRNTRLQLFKLLGEQLFAIVLEAAPPVMAYAQLSHCLQNIFGVRRPGIDDIS